MLMDFYQWADRVLIFFFRLPANPMAGYLLGIAVLSFICVLVGRMTSRLAYRANRDHFKAHNREMVRAHNLSMYALAARDKAAYQACNREANEAFGHYFFARAALSISALWPVPFALAWLDTRFGAVRFPLPVEFPLIGESVGYAFTFIPLYIMIFIVFSKISRRLPLGRGRAGAGNETGADAEQMISLADLRPK